MNAPALQQAQTIIPSEIDQGAAHFSAQLPRRHQYIWVIDLIERLSSLDRPDLRDVTSLVVALNRKGKLVAYRDFLSIFTPYKATAGSHNRVARADDRYTELVSYPLLSEENEKALCIALQIAQVAYRRALYSNIAMVDKAIERLQAIGIQDPATKDRISYTDVLVAYRGGGRAPQVIRSLLSDALPVLVALSSLYKQSKKPADRQLILERLFVILEMMPIKTEEFARDVLDSLRESQADRDSSNSEELSSYLNEVRDRERDFNQVLEVLCLANMQLVINLARPLASERMPLDDLVSEGYLALRKAACRFDYSQGNSFSTWAVPYIKGLLRNTLPEQDATVRVGAYRIECLMIALEKINKLSQKLGRKPSTEEIYGVLGEAHQEILKAMIFRGDGLRFEAVGGPDRIGCQADSDQPAANEDQIEAVRQALKDLTDARRNSIMQRYLINNSSDQASQNPNRLPTWIQVGELLSCTAQAAQQAGDAGIRQLQDILGVRQ